MTPSCALGEENLANGAVLDWLIDPKTRTGHIYRPDRPVERLERPAELRGDPGLGGSVG